MRKEKIRILNYNNQREYMSINIFIKFILKHNIKSYP